MREARPHFWIRSNMVPRYTQTLMIALLVMNNRLFGVHKHRFAFDAGHTPAVYAGGLATLVYHNMLTQRLRCFDSLYYAEQ